MIIAIIVFIQLCTVNNGAFWSDLPQHLVLTNILNLLSFKDKLQSISMLNRVTHQYFKENHRKEIKLVKLLNSMISKGAIYPNQTKQIKQKLKLSELFALQIPHFLEHINPESAEHIRRLVNGLNLYTMGISEFDGLNNNTDLTHEEQLFILSSRALINHFFTGSNTSNKPNIHVNVRAMFTINRRGASWVLDEFPWILFQYDESLDEMIYFYNGFIIYFSYLYEILWDKLKLNDIFIKNADASNTNTVKQQQIISLIDNHGLILWHKDVINKIRNDYFNGLNQKSHINYKQYGINFFDFVLEASRINDILFNKHSDENTCTEFMTNFILDIVSKYNADMHIAGSVMNSNDSDNVIKIAGDIIEQLRYSNHLIGNYHEFKELTILLLNISHFDDNIRFRFKSIYIYDTINVLWQYKPNRMYWELNKNVIESLTKLIILRIRLCWFTNTLKAYQEMPRLALLANNELFTVDLIKIIVECESKKFNTSGNKTFEYLEDIISILFGFEVDLHFDDALELPLSTQITESLQNIKQLIRNMTLNKLHSSK